MKKKKKVETPRRISHARTLTKTHSNPRKFDYSLDYKKLNLRRKPELYRVGVGEQGVLLVEPYKSEILPFWKFKSPDIAQNSAEEILRLFRRYKRAKDFIGMDMARKFLQMGFTRSRRYANHKSGTKYSKSGRVLPFNNDPVKAASAKVFKKTWEQVEADRTYARLKEKWKKDLG